MAARLNILLIDDHALFREGLALLLQRLDPSIQVDQAAGCEQALAHLDRHGAADLALVDLMLPGMTGMQGLALLRQRWPQMPAVALSSDDSLATVTAALDEGAMGFIPKSASSPELAEALQVVLRRGIYVPWRERSPGGPPPAPAMAETRPVGSTPSQVLGLTPRQSDVLRLILQGLPTKLICRRLELSEGTVKTHTTAVLRALNVTTRTQAVIAASRLGLQFDD